MKRLFRSYLKVYNGIPSPVWMLAAVQLINRGGSMVLPFLFVYLTNAEQYSIVDAGFVLTMFGAGSMAGGYLGGFFSDRVGPFRVQIFSLMAGGFFYLFIPLCPDLTSLCVTVFVCACINDSLRPANSSMVAHFAGGETLTRSFSLIRMAFNLGFSFGPALAGILAGINYNLLFIVDAATNLGAGILFYYYFKDKIPLQQHAEHKAERNILKPLRDGVFMLSGLFVIFYAISFFQLFSGLPLYYKQEYAMDEKGIGLLLALNGVIVFCLEMILVFNLEKKFAVRTLIMTGCLLLACSYFIFNIYHGIAVLILSMVLLSISEIFAMPFMMSYIISRADAANRGNYIGLYTIFWSIATILAPLISSHTIEYFSFTTLWWVLGLLTVGTSFGFGFAMRTPTIKSKPAMGGD